MSAIATPDNHHGERKSAVAARIIAGSLGSIVTALVVTPLEVVKVRQQLSGTGNAAGLRSTFTRLVQPHLESCGKGCGCFVLFNGHTDLVLPKSAAKFFDEKTGKLAEHHVQSTTVLAPRPIMKQPGVFTLMRRIFVNEGFQGIYAGLRPTLVMAVPSTVLYFTAYEEIVWRLRHYQSQRNYSSARNIKEKWTSAMLSPDLAPLVAGGSARLLSTIVTAPFEMLRTRQASAVGSDRTALGMWEEFRLIVHTEGVKALYRGLGSTLWRDVPFSAIYWLCLERFRDVWVNYYASTSRTHVISPLERGGQEFVNGAIAGALAAAITTPFDVVKTRQQVFVLDAGENVVMMAATAATAAATTGSSAAAVTTQGVIAYSNQSHKGPPGIIAILQQVVRTEGLAGLWRGNNARMLKVAPACAIMISTYEIGKRLLS